MVGEEPDEWYEEMLEQQEQKATVAFLYDDSMSVYQRTTSVFPVSSFNEQITYTWTLHLVAEVLLCSLDFIGRSIGLSITLSTFCVQWKIFMLVK